MEAIFVSLQGKEKSLNEGSGGGVRGANIV